MRQQIQGWGTPAAGIEKLVPEIAGLCEKFIVYSRYQHSGAAEIPDAAPGFGQTDTQPKAITIRPMNVKNVLRGVVACAGIAACVQFTPAPEARAARPDWTDKAVENARKQIGLEIDTIEASGKCLNPVTLTPGGKVVYCGYADWRSGFFPGSVW